MHATAEAFGHCHNEGFYALSQRRPLGIITEKAFIHRHSRVIIDLRNFPGFLKKGGRIHPRGTRYFVRKAPTYQ
eukprot:scaffold16847_cov17-Tisochrysis_lutea.AAC.3